ncbi:serine acetyltransferase [Pseudescherichia sp.]|uniref:serine acetyltransferase n=1 Tax=Pseudescherichia sp. TaxID=2055881 RepID=UPI00289CE556|nr:serine acetyltransferase [Pseudescherichia sp.]
MQDLKIEYREGDLVELSIDGICFKSVTAMSLHHEAGKTLPVITLTIPLGVGKRLEPASLARENLQIIEK